MSNPWPDHALRLGLVMMRDDLTYPDDLKSTPWVQDRLQEVVWSTETREHLKALVLRWAERQEPTAVGAMKQALGEEGPTDMPLKQITPATVWAATGARASLVSGQERSPLMSIATLEQERSMVDVYGEPEAREELHRQKALMDVAPYNTPPGKLEAAFRLVNDGRVTLGEDTITVKGSQGDTYTIVANRCNCGHATAGGKREALKWSCLHAVAAELHQRTQQALEGLAAPSLFALPPSTAVSPSAHMAVHLHECPTCSREWECSVLCGTLSVEKLCPTCAVVGAAPDSPSPTTIEDAMAEGGWSEPSPAEAWAARRRQNAPTPTEEEAVPTETLETPPVPAIAVEAPRSPQEPQDAHGHALPPVSPVEASSVPQESLSSAQAWQDAPTGVVRVESPEKALASVPVQSQALTLRGPLALFAEDLATWGAQRDMIMGFIKERLKPGVDYGPVHVSKNCESYKTRRECTNKYHWSKDSLRKPGAEKVTTLLRLRPEFVRDQDTWEMLGSPAGVLCYRCLLISPSGEIVGEGRAARDINKQDYGDINKGIKMCEKSAHLDAVIRVAGISDVFTQDLEDMPESEERSPVPTQPHVQTSSTAAKQREEIWQLLRKQGFEGKGWEGAARLIEKWCGVRMHPDNYTGIIDALKQRPALAPTGAERRPHDPPVQ